MATAKRTDPFLLTVLNQTTGQRFSQAGTRKELDAAAAEQKKRWKGDKLEVQVTRR